jgi:hypothetical protein
VLPLCARHSLDPDAVLLSYALMCAAALVRRRRGGDFTTEQRAVAVVRSMSNNTTAGSSGRSGSGARRSEAVLALLRSASFPFSPELWQLAQEAVHWGGALSEDLQEAARVLQLAQIVQRHRVQGYDLLDPAHATRLARHIAAQMGHCSGALQDALQVAAAYSHLDARRVYIDCLQNLALSSGATAAATAAAADDRCDTATAATAGDDGSAVAGATPAASSQAAALSAHSARVTAVLAQAPAGDAWSIAQEVLLFCLRSLEEHELQTDSNITQQQQQQYDSEAAALQQEAETEARYATAAAIALATFLQTQQQQPGGLAAAAASSQASALSVRQRVLHVSPAALLPLLRRLQALQLEFNIYLSVNTLQRRPDSCWAMVKQHLDALTQSSTSSSNSSSTTAARHSNSMRSRPVTTTISGTASSSNSSNSAIKGSNGKKGGSTAVHEAGVSALLQKARRLAELLGVKHERVVGYAAHEAAKQGRIHAALGLCNGLFKVYIQLINHTVVLVVFCDQ